MALNGHHWEALTLNGLAHSVELGWEPQVAIKAIEAGAVASGLSGKGPATVAIVEKTRLPRVRSALSHFRGQLVEARLNNKKARIVAKCI
jgi:shikimate kinase